MRERSVAVMGRIVAAVAGGAVLASGLGASVASAAPVEVLSTSLTVQVIQTGGSSGASVQVWSGGVDVTATYCATDAGGDDALGAAVACSGLPVGEYTLQPAGTGPDDVFEVNCVGRPMWETTHYETVRVSSDEPAWQCQLWVGPPAIMYSKYEGPGVGWTPSVLVDAAGDEVACQPDGRTYPNLAYLGPMPDIPEAPSETFTIDDWCPVPAGDYEVRPVETRPGYFYGQGCTTLPYRTGGSSRPTATVSSEAPYWQCGTASETATLWASVSIHGPSGPPNVDDVGLLADVTISITPTGTTAAIGEGLGCATGEEMLPFMVFRCALLPGTYVVTLENLPAGVMNPVLAGTGENLCTVTIPEEPTESESCTFQVERTPPAPVEQPTTIPLPSTLPETGSGAGTLAVLAAMLVLLGTGAVLAARRSGATRLQG